MKRYIGFYILLAIILLPLDSVPGVLPSVYRPISVIVLVFIFPLIVIMKAFERKRIKITNLLIMLFYITTITISYILSNNIYNDLSGFYDFTITLTIGLVSYFSFDYYFSIVRNRFVSNEEYIYWIFNILGKVYIPVLIYGIYEVLTMLGLIPSGLKDLVLKYLTGRGGPRVQLTSGEPSWASMHMIFIIPIYYYLMQKNIKFKKYFYLSIIIFMLMFSLQGILMVVFGLTLYLIIGKKYRELFKYLFYSLCFFIAFFFIWKLLGNSFGSAYYITRIGKIFNISNLSDLIYIDGSIFIRTVFPFIGFLIFENNILTGVGGGNFRYELGTYITQFFPSGLRFYEVEGSIKGLSGNPKSMYSRLLAETGLIGTVIYSWFLYLLFKKIKIKNYISSNIVKLFFLFLISIYLQFDSFAYIHLWLGFAILNNLQSERDQGY